ncbi:MAG: CAP domain-containing protein [Pseudomonadota bacterium]
MKPPVLVNALCGLTALFWCPLALAQDTQAECVWLQDHNRAREAFGSTALQWDAQLARDAEEWARYLARRNTLQHSANDMRRGAGENLWMGSRGYFKPSQMIASFVDEGADFVPGRFPEVSRTGSWRDVGHYTQIVWPRTQKVGCAMAAGQHFDVLVCRYWPAGNVVGTTIAPLGRVAAK